MSRARTFPLGIDLGDDRVRIALVERTGDGDLALCAVASRPAAPDPCAALVDAFEELGTRERRCVLAAAGRDALLRTATFPPLARRERERAARFEASRSVPYPLDDAAVRVVPIDAQRCAIATAPRADVQARSALARRAGLRPVAVDHPALALLRAIPEAAAIVDVGAGATILIVRDEPVPTQRVMPIGGASLTGAIADALGVDRVTAEQRKRTMGMAGAGEHVRDALVEHLAQALAETRAAARADVTSLVLAGNGSRLAGFADALERAAGIPVMTASLHGTHALPADVVRAASPDWALAYGLAMWECAA
ncbi:pilus assembly protein PilM [Vulcanimicrobium alpinum]|uniref:Pilus assembly protein PilM n=1 Tax=Vulcanimicrobium alpinum TaxID=3016050 RepID=A0AAN2C9W7_UNVUL|nr:pilus assembly protein PilM [Vulcanimicrobium alpinum]BDE06388.1 pilus assembly protein PilM [Vulcanimicrobium alpinum]